MIDTPWTALRESTRLSQREVERRLGWNRGTLSLIERGLRQPEREVELRTFYASFGRDEQTPPEVPSAPAQ